MRQDIRLAAILERDGRLFLVRPEQEASWELPGGPLPLGNDDIDAEMVAVLQRLGVMAPAIEQDFLQTHYFPAEDGQVVYNVYAATDWAGDPAPAPGVGAGWFHIEEIATLDIHEWARGAVLEAFGLREREDDTAKILAALNAEMLAASRAGPPPDAPPARDIIDSALADVWADPALDGKTRSLMVVAMLAAMGRAEGPLASHIEGALNHGATPEQVVQTLRLVAMYAGLPAALEAWPAMEKVFERQGMPLPRRLA